MTFEIDLSINNLFKMDYQSFHKIGPDTYMVMVLSPFGTQIKYYITDINDHATFQIHISIIKLLIDTLEIISK
jgi:hypothetical protein